MNADEQARNKATRERVTSLHWWTDRLFTFRTTKPAAYSFTAGQYARLGLEDASGMIWRPYSMTSSPADRELEFYGILVPDGLFTSRVRQMQAGDAIWVERQVYGFMTVDRFTQADTLWMLSSGTGVGPFISILRDPYVWGRFQQLVLVHGVRHSAELTYQEELRALQQSPPAPAPAARLQILRCTTRDVPAQTGVLDGRITALLQSGTLESAAGALLEPEKARVMMCGNPEMIEDMRKLLHQRGMRPVRRALPGHFITENYW